MNMAKTILVIDDDRKFSLGLVAVLRREGFQVLSAGNGVEGMAAIRAARPDIILCDIMMPPPNGIQLKKDISIDPVSRQIPFLFLTARTAQVDKLAGLQSGADDYITKPFDVNELLARIQSVLRRDEQGHQRGIQESIADLDKLRSNISTNLSHEMRTPLTVILSTLELILKEKFSRDNVELDNYLNKANSSAYRLKFLVEDLEMLYDLDQSNLPFLAQRIDINFNLKTPIGLTLQTWESKKLDVQILIDRETIIYAPREKFAHVVCHLVDNACKFSSEKGKVIIKVGSDDVGGCVIEVENEGLPIPVELREKVFDRYFQISQGETREFGGLGVGLTIARGYARAWGGDVRILDKDNGCCVQMVLPPYKLD
jgi:signal transduction histidine kinase